ncbi:unnamed protein product [Calypogeia fissa]
MRNRWRRRARRMRWNFGDSRFKGFSGVRNLLGDRALCPSCLRLSCGPSGVVNKFELECLVGPLTRHWIHLIVKFPKVYLGASPASGFTGPP